MLAHIDLDAFYASVEELDNPELKGQPLIVGGLNGRGVVSACSYAARKFGVRSAMAIFQARKLCPKAVFLPVRMARYRELSQVVMEILDSFTPVVEQISIDEAFLDLSGTEHLWGGGSLSTARLIKQTIREKTGLSCSIGVAPLRFMAKIASERSKPDGLLLVEDKEQFLQSIKLKEVSGVGARTLVNLQQLGLHNLVDLRNLSPEFVNRRLGKYGMTLWNLAHGEDARGVSPGHTVKSISHEQTFLEDVTDHDIIRSHLMALCQKVARRLRAGGLSASSITLKVKFPDFKLKTFSKSLAQPTDLTLDFYNNLQGFLEKEWKIRLLGVVGSGLNKPAQPGLFNQWRQHSLHQAEDILYERFGPKGITRASTLLTSKGKEK